MSRREHFKAFKEGDYDAVMPRFGIRSGDTVYVPAGVIHSSGPGALVFEVQQTSDPSQSVIPEDLFGNPLDAATREQNIDAALDELRTHYLPPEPRLCAGGRPNRRGLCCAGPYFALERWTLAETYVEPAHPERFMTLSNALGTRCASSTRAERLERAESYILPASMGEARAVPEGGEASIVACYVPDLEQDVVAPLREARHSGEEIRALREVTV